MPTRPSISIARVRRLLRLSPSWIRAISAIWRPTVCTGLSAVSGSWKIIAISPPRTERIRDSSAVSRSSPFQNTPSASMIAGGLGISPMMLIAVTDLPEPDSPTTANTSPRLMSKLTPSTACTVPASVVKLVCRFCTDSSDALVGGRRPGRGDGGGLGHGASLQLRVERVAQAVADEHEGEHGQEDGQCRGRTAGAAPMVSEPAPASATIRPHAGVGGCGPTPRNDSAASDRITPPIDTVP